MFLTFIMLSIPVLYGCNPHKNIECVYVPQKTQANQYPELTQYTDCAYISDKQEIIINERHFNKIEFNDAGLAEIRILDGVYYLNKQGKIIKSYLFDNGADYFQEGLSRTKQNNKIGFIDATLNIVIQPVYDFAFPFSGGVSVVCMGCREVKTGEHSAIKNGKWGVIDKSGNVVIDILHNYDDLSRMGIKNED